MEILEILSNSILVASGLIRSAASYTTTYTHAGAGVYDELLMRQILSGWWGWMMRGKGLPLVHLAHLLIFGCLPGQARTDDCGASNSLGGRLATGRKTHLCHFAAVWIKILMRNWLARYLCRAYVANFRDVITSICKFDLCLPSLCALLGGNHSRERVLKL